MKKTMYRSGSTKLVRNLNKQHVLNLVRMHSGTTARDISRITKLQMSTVLYTLRSLRDAGLLKEVGYGKSTIQGGKPPVVWDIAPEYGYIVGIGLISKEIRIVIMEFNANIILKKQVSVEKVNQPEDIVYQIVSVINNSLCEKNIPIEKVLGIGIGFSGVVNYELGSILKSKGLHFEDVKLRDLLDKHFDIPIFIENNANAGALAMKWLNEEAHTVPNIIYLSIHKVFGAMGAGFIIGHKLFHGANYSAGEISSFMVKSDWKNFLESAKSKYDDYDQLLNKNDATEEIPVSIPTVIEMAKKKNKAAISIMKNIGEELSRQLILQIDLLNPDVIYMGGGLCEAKEYFEPLIRTNIEMKVVNDQAKKTPVRYSPFGLYTVAMGGAALVFYNIFGIH